MTPEQARAGTELPETLTVKILRHHYDAARQAVMADKDATRTCVISQALNEQYGHLGQWITALYHSRVTGDDSSVPFSVLYMLDEAGCRVRRDFDRDQLGLGQGEAEFTLIRGHHPGLRDMP